MSYPGFEEEVINMGIEDLYRIMSEDRVNGFVVELPKGRKITLDRIYDIIHDEGVVRAFSVDGTLIYFTVKRKKNGQLKLLATQISVLSR